MKWAYDLTGAEPIIKDLPVYDAATIAQGELVMIGTSAFTAGADAGYGMVSAYPSTVMANGAVNAVGVSLETKTTADVPSIAAACNVTTGKFCTAKVIINPTAVYRAEVTTAEQLSIASSASTGAFAVTGAAGTSGDRCGQWVYFCASAGPNFGNIRKVVTTATAGSFVMDASVSATITTADKIIFITERNKSPEILGTDAITIGQTTVGGGAGATTLKVVENYIDRGNGLELLRPATHSQIKLGSDAAKKVKFYQDIVLVDHLFGNA